MPASAPSTRPPTFNITSLFKELPLGVEFLTDGSYFLGVNPPNPSCLLPRDDNTDGAGSVFFAHLRIGSSRMVFGVDTTGAGLVLQRELPVGVDGGQVEPVTGLEVV